MPIVSVISTCYNQAHFIEETIRSVQVQTFRDWEMVVVNDGSTDDSAAVVERLVASDDRIRLVSQQNGGLSSARNCGYAAASPDSRYLLFLDGDDTLAADALQTLATHLDLHPEASLVSGDFLYMDERGVPMSDSPPPWSYRYNRWTLDAHGRPTRIPLDQPDSGFRSFFAWTGTIPSATLLRRSVYAETAGFDPSIRAFSEDVDVFYHMALIAQPHYLPRPVTFYRRHSAQITSAAKSRQARDAERAMYRKWLTRRDIPAEWGERIREAWHFRQAVLLPRLCLGWSAEHMRRGSVVGAAREVVCAARHVIRHFTELRASHAAFRDDPSRRALPHVPFPSSTDEARNGTT